jgi:hypothetical protein
MDDRTPAQTKVVRDEVTSVRTVVTIGPVDGRELGTFGWFIGIRNRHRDPAKDRTKYGTCVICRSKFADDDPIHLVFNVARNGRTIGNRLCCTPCAEQHATFQRAAPDG